MVQVIEIVALSSPRIFGREEFVIESNLSIDRVSGAYPMTASLYLPLVFGRSTPRDSGS
jgi:hypothetical protein